MGLPGALIGGMLVGSALGLFGSRNQTDYSSMFSPTPILNAAPVPTAPQAPTVTNSDGSAQKSASILQAEDEERKRMAAEKEANKTNFTGGLGLTSPANVQRKTLLG